MSNRSLQGSLMLGLWLSFVMAPCAQSVKPANPDSTLARAVQLHQAGEWEKAIQEYQAFLALRPERTDARSNLGAALARLGRYQEAIEQYQRALLLDSRNPDIRFNLAAAYYKTARVALAVQELEKIRALQPNQQNATLLLADCYLQMGEYQKVIAMLAPYEEKFPQDKALAYLLGTALLRDKQVEKGQQQIEKIMRGGESAEVHMLLGTTYLLTGEAANAAKELAAAAKLNPKLPTVHAFYGRALTMTGNTDQAKEEFRLELENNPNDFDAKLRSYPKLTFKSGPYDFSIVRQGQQSIYAVTDGQETIAAPILYAFGQGKAGQTYVLEYQGRYYESRVSFYNEIKGLDYTLGAPRKPANTLLEAFGRLMDSLDTKDCFSCHATAAVSEGQLQLSKLTPGITCEGCHGAGEKHVALMKDKSAKQEGDKAIFNPGRFDTEGQTQFCGSCHRTWAQVQLMKVQGVLNVRFQPYRIFGSKCYDFEDKRISCTACHNPHEAMNQPLTYYDAKCVACHSNATASVKMSAPCKTGKTTNCISCHMPQYELPGSHHKFSDHQIRIVRAGEAYPN